MRDAECEMRDARCGMRQAGCGFWKAVLGLALILVQTGCGQLESPERAVSVGLSVLRVDRTVSDQNPRVFTCTVQLVARAIGPASATLVELLTLERVIDIEGGTSISSSPAHTRFSGRRLNAGESQSASDAFSATFPFAARFQYKLRYRDLNLRTDSAITSTQCG